MAPRDNLFSRLQHLEQAASSERQAARQRRQQQSSAEILQTFLAYRLDDAAEKMAREEHKKSNVTEEWCHSDAELDYDIFEIEEEDNG